LDEIQSLIGEKLSGHKAWQHASYVSQFIRTPGSAGERRTVQYAREQLEKYGLDKVFTVKYPSKEHRTEDFSFVGWDIRDARLELVEPIRETITSFDQSPTCVQPWSKSTPSGGVVAELVDVGRGVDESDYLGKDLLGKIALASGDGHAEGNTQAYLLSVEEHKAIGLITDNLIRQQPPFRLRENCPDSISFLRVPSRKGDGWGFTISHTQGERLRSLLGKGPLKLRVFIDAEMTQGNGEVLVGEIRGKGNPDQEIWVVAHSSGSKPGGNCAGGVGLWIETARVITALREKIPNPERTIRFLLGTEGLGISAYVKSHPETIGGVVAALVYCSVGNDQFKCSSSLVLYKSPESIPSFVNDLCAHTIEQVSKDALPPFKDMTRDIQLVRFNVLPYTPWSDNAELTALKIPCPLFMSWPDIHFHTQFSTADKLDPAVLKRCGEVTTGVALTIATAGTLEATLIGHIVRTRAVSKLVNVSVQAISQLLGVIRQASNREILDREIEREVDDIVIRRKGELAYLVERSLAAIRSLELLSGDSTWEMQASQFVNDILSRKKIEEEKIDGFRSTILWRT